MKRFYLTRNQNGYYRVSFIDPVTGSRGPGKSTHTKDKEEATIIASQWLNGNVPKAMAHSRAFAAGTSETYSGDLKSFVSHLSENDAYEILELISQKFHLDIPTSQINPASNAATTSDVIPSKKRFIVIKKNPSQTVEVKSEKQEKHNLYETLLNFWDYDKSDFIQRHLAHGHSMSKKHTIQMQAFVRNNWLPYFGDEKCIEDLTRMELDDFFFYLHSERGFSGETVNKNINCANRCFGWLFTNGKIPTNPLKGIERFKVDAQDRGIPTESEVKKLLALDWENQAAYLAFKLGAFCGLRAGEISGLRVCDIDVTGDMIHVRHSYSEIDGLKSTKNKDTRDLPIDHQTVMQLANHARTNPEYNELSYVFYQPKKPDKAYYPGYYNDIFYLALEKIGISEAERKDRNIVFHSLRHFCATILAQRTDMKTVQSIMGHRTEKMSEHYSDHDTMEKFDNMRVIMSEAWEKYLSA